jgi:protein ImuB
MFWVALQAQPDMSPPDLADAAEALGWWALQFTPKVARVDDTVLMELCACERLWHGRARLLRHIHVSEKPVSGVRYAQGETSLIAMARLQEVTFQASQASSKRRTAPDDLPLATLVAARPHLATLARIGCTRWGQLRALPRGGVARRFGADLLDALDRAYGEKPDSYPWLLIPDRFEATLEFDAQVETAPALLFGARRLLNQLRLWLQARHWGVLALVLGWTMDQRRDSASRGELVLRTGEPSIDMLHLQRLLAEQLARISLRAPVLSLHLRSLETEKLHGKTAALLNAEQAAGDSLLQMQERLSARLGTQRVLQVRACAEHRPERMQLWQAVADCALQTQKFKDTCLYPTWLLAVPLKLTQREHQPQYHGTLTLLAGPQRLEAAGWDTADCALRDYFLARSAKGSLLWIYRERLSGACAATAPDSAWYLHGIFA